jgi:hypothetical protein
MAARMAGRLAWSLARRAVRCVAALLRFAVELGVAQAAAALEGGVR